MTSIMRTVDLWQDDLDWGAAPSHSFGLDQITTRYCRKAHLVIID